MKSEKLDKLITFGVDMNTATVDLPEPILAEQKAAFRRLRQALLAWKLERYGLDCLFKDNGTVDLYDNEEHEFIANVPYGDEGLDSLALTPYHPPILSRK
jgi:hypothetical protein